MLMLLPRGNRMLQIFQTQEQLQQRVYRRGRLRQRACLFHALAPSPCKQSQALDSMITEWYWLLSGTCWRETAESAGIQRLLKAQLTTQAAAAGHEDEELGAQARACPGRIEEQRQGLGHVMCGFRQ